MTKQLTEAVDAAGEYQAQRLFEMLLETGWHHHLDEDPRSIIFGALAVALYHPTDGVHRFLSMAVTTATAHRPEAVAEVLADLRADEMAGDRLIAAAADELEATADLAERAVKRLRDQLDGIRGPDDLPPAA